MKLSEEEKIAKLELNRFIYGKQLSKDDIVDYLSILFNLIDKQQKELEEIKLDLEEMEKSNNHKLENWVHKYALNSYISKAKIREKIKKAKEIKWHTPKLVIEYFEELLEED